LLADGATGTQLQLLGLAPGACGEHWNVEHPERVQQVHRAYLAAGADLLTTNSFGGSSLALARHGLRNRAHELNVAAARLAREVAGNEAWVLGDIGPFGGLLEPLGDGTPEEVTAAFRRQTAALLAGGADAILVETMSDPLEATFAIGAARNAGAELIFATFTFQRAPDGFRTLMGSTVAECVSSALSSGAEIVGANCGTELSLADYEKLTVEFVAAACGAPVIVQPNAGSPRLIDDRVSYDESAADFAAAAPRFLAAGARVVGGCCGSTPAHTAAVSAALRR
jgi:5-methyltetrahydrofolate--homocysteine methyltransferase